MQRHSLYFTVPGQVEVCTEPLTAPGPGDALVQTVCSAISAGTELLVYRGQFPRDLAVDATISALSGGFAYPVRYGYAAVGHVVEVGSEVAANWVGRLVFAFQPHTSAFVAPVAELLPVTEGLSAENAVFLPNMETAVNFLLDGAPLIGERVAVFGQGVVGLLTTALLARLPLGALTTFDQFALRREWSVKLGAHTSADPATLAEEPALDADLCYELTGSPATLDEALAAAGFAGRIVVGSWYGEKRHPVNLGGRFHRERLRLISSQVSTLTPELHARWTKARRLQVAWQRLSDVKPSQLITHYFPLSSAPEAYALLDQQPDQTLQVVFRY